MASFSNGLTPPTPPPRPASPFPSCRPRISCPTPRPIHQLPSSTNHVAAPPPPSTQLYPVVDVEEPELSDCESDCSDEDSKIQPTRTSFAGIRTGFIPPLRDVEEARTSINFSSTIISSPSATLTSTPRLETKEFKPHALLVETDPFVSHGLDSSPLPPKKGPRFYRYLRWNFGSVYRRIFCLVYLVNMVVLAVLIARYAISRDLERFKLTYQQASIGVTANILAAVTVRNEHVINAMFWVFGTWTTSLPLRFRTLAAKVYSYGGIHSAGAVAATFWYMAFLVLLTMEFQKAESLTISRSYIYLVSYFILFLLVSMLISTHPHLRRTMHNWFEGIHRFMGWLAILLFWAQAMLLAADASQTSGASFSTALLVSPNFWMLIPITLLVIYPWTRLRLRPVDAEVLSQHCVKLNFTYRNVHYGQAIRLTDAPLRETHAFGVMPFPSAPDSISHCSGYINQTHTEKIPIPLKDNNESTPSLATLRNHTLTSPSTAGQLTHTGERGFSVIISNAGDWTSKTIACPPSHIYTRGTPQFGVMRCAGLFSPCVVVATGSGIAPCLSLFVQRPHHPVRIIWSTRDPVATYGRQVVELVYKTDPDAVVVDTRLGGAKKGTSRPDLVKLAYRVWEEGREVGGVRRKGEAVVVISNQRVTKKVVYGLETRGVPAYGAIFDS